MAIKKTPISAAPPAQEPVSTEIARTIDLSPEDWFWATWRNRTQKKRTEPRPFDLEECVARLSRVTTTDYGLVWNWQKAQIDDCLTPAEGLFWFTAMEMSSMGHASRALQPKMLAAQLARGSFEQPVSSADIRNRITGMRSGRLQQWLMIPLATLLSFRELTTLLQEDKLLGTRYGQYYLFAGFIKHVLPYVNHKEIELLRRELCSRITPDKWPQDIEPVNVFHLAACLGMSTELSAVVESWADDYFVLREAHEYHQRPQYVIFGLGNGRNVESHMRRLKLGPRTAQQIAAWVACTEYEGLDLVRDAILAATKRDLAEEMLQVFSLVQAPEAAPFMLELSLESKAPAVARRWLDENPRWCAAPAC